jgi:hypothetical protein
MNTVLRVVGLAFLVVLAGCSTPPEPEDHVATLETTGSSAPPAASVSSTDPAASRPRERLDMTVDEINEMYQAYDRCLADNGYNSGKIESGDGRGPAEGQTPDESKLPAAEAACLGRKPLPPWEYDVGNPESADFVHAVVQCLRDKGVRYVEEGPLTPGEDRRVLSLGGENNDSESISKGLDLIPICEKEQAGNR